MHKFLIWLKWSIATMLGLYCGLLLSAGAIGLYQGGYFILFAFGGLFMFGPLAIICLVPFIIVYKLIKGFNFKQSANLKVVFTQTLLSGFLGLSIVYEGTKIPGVSTNSDATLIPFATIIVALIVIALVFVLSAHKYLKSRNFSEKKVLCYLLTLMMAIFAIQYYFSLPHLTSVCRGIETGSSRADAIEMLQPFRYRDVNGLQYKNTNADQLEANEGNIFIQDNGVFCRITIEEGVVTDSHFIMDGP